eukprot:scaffold1190_cov69-Cylindrotheca_fusiformis.AAC.6
MTTGEKDDEKKFTRLSSQDASAVAGGENENSILTRVLYIPGGDKFEISANFKDLAAIVPQSEGLASHSFIIAHADAMKSVDETTKDGFLNSCVRKKENQSMGELVWSIAGVESTDVTNQANKKRRL